MRLDGEVVKEGQISIPLFAIHCWLIEPFRQGTLMAAIGWELYQVGLSSISVNLGLISQVDDLADFPSQN